MEVAGLLHDALAGVEPRALSLDLVADGALHAAQRVDVLGLRAGAELLAALWHQRQVDVAAQAALLHPYVGDVQSAQQIAQLCDISPRDSSSAVSGACNGTGHDLDERDAGTVVVD